MNISIWQARYYDGLSAASHAAEVTLGPSSLTFKTEGVSHSWPYKEISQTLGHYPGEPVRLERGTEAISVDDPAFRETLKKTSKTSFKRRPLAGRRLLFWLPILLIIGLGSTAALYFKGIPAASSYVADFIPPSLEIKLGHTTEKSLLAAFDEYENAEMSEAVRVIVERLMVGVGETPYELNVKIVDAPVKNAFALPGGRILLFKGLIESTETPEELAGVLAHEMVHVLKRHSTKGMLRQLSTYMLFSFMTGDVNTIASIAQNLGNMRYSREFETEADIVGTQLLIASGIDPAGLRDFFGKLSEDGINNETPGPFSYLSTHPVSEQRVDSIAAEEESYTSTEPGAYRALLAGVDWKGLIACTCKETHNHDDNSTDPRTNHPSK
ncbi:MAG: M48 family metallopeptidase [Proteobacteria bacterium]|nr:M48 family metallopeptidase [Pseudomonadota bacterium]